MQLPILGGVRRRCAEDQVYLIDRSNVKLGGAGVGIRLLQWTDLYVLRSECHIVRRP